MVCHDLKVGVINMFQKCWGKPATLRASSPPGWVSSHRHHHGNTDAEDGWVAMWR